MCKWLTMAQISCQWYMHWRVILVFSVDEFYLTLFVTKKYVIWIIATPACCNVYFYCTQWINNWHGLSVKLQIKPSLIIEHTGNVIVYSSQIDKLLINFHSSYNICSVFGDITTGTFIHIYSYHIVERYVYG